METKILVPVDGSATSMKTIDAIIARKERFPAPLTLLHVVDLDRLAYRMIPDFQVAMIREHARRAGEQLLNSTQEHFSRAGMSTELRLEFGSPREIICHIANDEGFELLILGRRGLGEIRDVLFGSVANHALHHVRCPVLLF
ncbi:MAG TPA: universal stress protein [Desulfuromonadales bacterium]|nr:universal stress protein [Desulfuromonadales bacterium]